MIQQTQDQWLGSNYLASSVEGGLAFPRFENSESFFNLKTLSTASNNDLLGQIKTFLNDETPGFLNVVISSKERVVPQVRYGKSIEDSEPALDPKQLEREMSADL